MQPADAVDFRLLREVRKVEAEAYFDVLLREVVAVNQHFANLVGGIGILALVGAVVLEQELAVILMSSAAQVL